MALPIDEAPELEDSTALTDDEAYAIISTMLEALDAETAEMEQYRDYYDGDQELRYATDEFVKAFGDEFGDLKANWCEGAITATEERLELDRIVIRSEERGEVDTDMTDTLREIIFDDNDMDSMEDELYSGAQVESRSALLVWPTDNEDKPYSIHVMKGDTFKVVYDDNDRTAIRFAIRRWRDEVGQTFVTLYTPSYLYKYVIPKQFVELRGRRVDDASFESSGWRRRTPEMTGDPSWPLPNPFDEIPIAEFTARKHRSELQNLWPIQDLINKFLVNMAVAGDYAAHKQAYIISTNEPPDGGWKRRPGEVWGIQPEVDLDGKALPTDVGELDAMDPSNFIAIIEHLLSQFSNLSSTPGYYIFNSNSQSGRGDAPSGDSLRVAETKLIKKVEKYQERFTTPWVKVARLILADMDASADYIEVSWENPQRHFMGMLLEEANKMINELKLPPRVAWKHIGLSEAEIEEAEAYREEREQKELERAEQDFQRQQVKSNAQRPGNGIPQNDANQMDNGGTPSNS